MKQSLLLKKNNRRECLVENVYEVHEISAHRR